jgi:eukaryotic-like serine/threonine-protein kinase
MQMNPFEQIESIFWKATQLAKPEQREEYLAAACDGDQQLRTQIEQMLAMVSVADRFVGAYAPTLTSAADALIGATIGPYKIREKIGEGGMGIVYAAQQQEPLRRLVALKIIKPGMDSQQIIARFQSEREALALMDHPHIARVLDAGTTQRGLPFFVMELVHGVPITRFADQQRLTLAERLKLFQDVCHAVQHAHMKGGIHRDIKPSNVLVSLQDAKPIVKVIDFGLAKAIGKQLSERTVYTAMGQMVGTPMYMSPEQVERSGVDVDTRSDVYSLGVLLYQLLTRSTPFDQESFRTIGLEAMLRIIREEDPLKPSQRLSTVKDESQFCEAESRQVDVKRLIKSLRGELDWIVMKAMEKERNRRYDSPSELAEDLERYLTQQPVLAGPQLLRYKLRKLVRRHRVTVLASAFVVFTLLIVAVISVRQAAIARQAEIRAHALLEENFLTQAKNGALLYAADMAFASQAIEEGDVGQATKLLQRQQPPSSPVSGLIGTHNPIVDHRGIEWSYLVNRTQFTKQRIDVTNGQLDTLAVQTGGLIAAVADDQGMLWLFDPSQPENRVKHEETGSIEALALSPDGTKVAIGKADGTVQVRNVRDWSSAYTGLAARGARALVFSQDGNHLIVGCGDPQVMIVELASGQAVKTLQHDGTGIQAVDLSKDGELLAVAPKNGQGTLWRWKTGERIHQWEAAEYRLTSIAISRDNKLIFDSDVKGGIRQIETATWKVQRLATVPSAIQAIAISPTSSQLAVACRSGIIHLFPITRRNVSGTDDKRSHTLARRVFQVHQARINAIHWFDEQNIATVSHDGTFAKSTMDPERGWESSTGFESTKFSVSPDGNWIAAHDHHRAQLIDTRSGKSRMLPNIISEMNLSGIGFTQDSRFLLLATADGRIATLNVDTPDIHCWNDAPLGADISEIRFSGDGQRLMLFSRTNDLVVVTQYPSMKVLFQASCPSSNTASISPDGNYLATSEQRAMTVYKVDTGEVAARSLNHHTETINDIHFGPGGDWIATTSDDRSIRIWNPWADSPPELVGIHPGGVPRSLSVSSDGKTLITSGRNGQVWLWNVPARQKLFKIAEQPVGYLQSDLSDNDRILITLEQDGRIRWLKFFH